MTDILFDLNAVPERSTSMGPLSAPGLPATATLKTNAEPSDEYENWVVGGGAFMLHHVGPSEGNRQRYLYFEVTNTAAIRVTRIRFRSNTNAGPSANLSIEKSETSNFAAPTLLGTVTTTGGPMSEKDLAVDARLPAGTHYIRIRATTAIPDGSAYIAYVGLRLSVEAVDMPLPFDWSNIKRINTEIRSTKEPAPGETFSLRLSDPVSADTDLFFWASTFETGVKPKGDAWLIVYNPVGKVHTASTCVQIETSGSKNIQHGSMFTPVRKGDEFAASFKENAYQFDGYILPVNLGFGSWEWLEIDKVYGPQQQDGFVAVSLHGQQQGTKYALKGLQSVPGSSEMALFAAATLHWEEATSAHIWAQGFCMPVPKGNSFKLEQEHLGGTAPEIRPFWLPIVGETYRFGPQKLVTNTIQPAPNDGILYGYAEAQANVSGYALLRRGHAQYAATSVQDNNVLSVKRQSITIPVRAGDTFYHTLASSVDGHFRYMPILGGS